MSHGLSLSPLENASVHPRIRFVLGPAGSGKTFRCLHEIREELRNAPEGLPLLMLAPKQATFQLERQLLETPAIPGWSRLQILSFDRLARQILQERGPKELLSEEGRIMVLRALLRRNQSHLRIFRATARLTGFAQELSATLRELQREQISPDRLERVAAELSGRSVLSDKLRDLALILREYLTWLKVHDLSDADSVPDLAASALKEGAIAFALEGVWLDGFAEMTAQELDLLTQVVRRSPRATLAFCADRPFSEDAPWLSNWAVVSQTFRGAHLRMASLPGASVEVEVLPRDPARSRFAGQEALAYLEKAWLASRAEIGAESNRTPPPSVGDAVALVACPDFEVEAEVAAREVWRSVRAGARFRDIAVLMRNLADDSAVLERVFARYEIPFFIDRREPLAHHPLAELTRCAIRLGAFGWQHEDWFGALKTGLTPVEPGLADHLENEALAQGWTGSFWSRAAKEIPPPLARFASELTGLLAAFHDFVVALHDAVDVETLARSLRLLWEELRVFPTMESWSAGDEVRTATSSQLHTSAREQIEGWLENLVRGFAGEKLPLVEWLPILESGLASLTAGVIPPAQDQVLIGAIDRSRQPELQVAIVPGLNEGRFPAPIPVAGLLSTPDREVLGDAGVALLPDRRRRIGHEYYFGYIAFTRARRRLVATWSERDAAGRAIHPSSFVTQVQRIFPGITVASALDDLVTADTAPSALAHLVQHPVELLPWLLARNERSGLEDLIRQTGDWTAIRKAWGIIPETQLRPESVELLFGHEPEVSVSALETLASCPFQFFVRHGLRGKERVTFEADPRHIGTLAHQLLAQFHQSLQAENLRWRDLDPSEARERFIQIAKVHPALKEGPLSATAQARWRSDSLVETLRECVGLLVEWAKKSEFDPAHAELAFGGGASLPSWRLSLGGERGLRIRGMVDRVDLCRSRPGETLFLVIDYKLRVPRLDDVLAAAGIDLQLAAYALALSGLTGWFESERPKRATPAGVFYVGLIDRPERARSRAEMPNPEDARAVSHLHRGRFRASAFPLLDRTAGKVGPRQFAFNFTRDGSLRQGGDAMNDEDFDAWLARIDLAIRDVGKRLLAGDVPVSPFRKGTLTACDYCDLRAVCRFDPWTQAYRRLGAV